MLTELEQALAVFDAAGYKRHPKGRFQHSTELFQRRAYWASEEEGDVFLNFDFYPEREMFGHHVACGWHGWTQVHAPEGWAFEVEVHTLSAKEIIKSLPAIEQQLLYPALDAIKKNMQRKAINDVLSAAMKFDDKPHQLFSAVRRLAVSAEHDLNRQREIIRLMDAAFNAQPPLSLPK